MAIAIYSLESALERCLAITDILLRLKFTPGECYLDLSQYEQFKLDPGDTMVGVAVVSKIEGKQLTFPVGAVSMPPDAVKRAWSLATEVWNTLSQGEREEAAKDFQKANPGANAAIVTNLVLHGFTARWA